MEFEQTVFYKSKRFAVRIIKLYKYLVETHNEYVLSKQILRSGTSIGANLSESQMAISRKDFRMKVYVSLKECCETAYWLELLVETDYIDQKMYDSLSSDCIEIRKMLAATTKTLAKKKQ